MKIIPVSPHPNHYRSDLTDDEARELFRRSVRYVEIELFSYCNRKCWFCPNANLPSRQDKAGNQYMDDKLYTRILKELESIEFAGNVQFGRYNEPLSDPIFMTRVQQARSYLPKAYLYTHTNGDFLTREYLDVLRDAGLNELAVQTYLGNNDRWDEQAMLDRQQQQLRKLGLRIRKAREATPGVRHYHETDYPGMLVMLDARNFEAMGTDRAGHVPIRQKEPRTSPCLVPFWGLYVDWTGDTVPCCNIRTDINPELSVCRLQDGHSIFDAFVALHGWRKSLMRFGEKGGPCATCRYDETAVPASEAGELERVYQLVENQ